MLIAALVYTAYLYMSASGEQKNLDKAKFTGDKFNQKVYHSYSGYHGGIRTRSLSELWARDPREVLRRVVYRMLPVNRSRDKVIQHLKFK